MRARLPTDDPALTAMLEAEGLRVEEMLFADHFTWVLERDGQARGFFTILPRWGRPFVVHFCTRRGKDGKRDAADGWALVRGLKKLLKATGAKKAIMTVPCGKGQILKAIKRLFHGEVYAVHDGEIYLTTEV